eukprot:symbB.v1.2.023976.t1/scaffold2236.1/size84961/10
MAERTEIDVSLKSKDPQTSVSTSGVPSDSSCDERGRLFPEALQGVACSSNQMSLQVDSSWSASEKLHPSLKPTLPTVLARSSVERLLLVDTQVKSSVLPPAEEENFWSVALWRNGSIVEGSYLMSWQVIPQLEESRLELVSEFRRAGAFPVTQPAFNFTDVIATMLEAFLWCVCQRFLLVWRTFCQVSSQKQEAGIPLPLSSLLVDREQSGTCSSYATIKANMHYIVVH